jgi:S-adenosylmethionine:tRNA ribosyltransferase-isomerase
MNTDQLPPALSDIRLSEYQYDLPADRIASHPLEKRDEAKLLTYWAGELSHQVFEQLPDLLPPDSLLVFNDTRVIHARLLMRRETGALIEILLLHPETPKEVAQAMLVEDTCVWACVIGRKKRWKAGEVLQMQVNESILLEAELIDREQNLVRFQWTGNVPWSELLHQVGKLPLPPYLHREATEQDETQYQTVYAREKGAVAAPTAGLHFTDPLLSTLQKRGIGQTYVTLHVSAGTFLPVKQDEVRHHDMHKEQIVIRAAQVREILANLGHIIPVGTTSLRLLESLYWLGVQLLLSDTSAVGPPLISQWYPYQWGDQRLPTAQESLEGVLAHMGRHNVSEMLAETEIFILPGYEFRLCRGLITNFHLPETTLLLLIAAMIGDDWRKVYASALENEYRFLSYGDSSLLLP